MSNLESDGHVEFDSITSASNPKIKRLRKLCLSTNSTSEQIVLEGTKLLAETLSSRGAPEEIFLTQEWLNKNELLISKFVSKSNIFIIPHSLMKSSISTVNPNGVVCIFNKVNLPQKPIDPEFILLLDRVQDPGNLGSIFRSSLAFGVDYILINQGANPFNQKVIRSSSGSILNVPFKRFAFNELENSFESIKEVIDYYKNKSFQIVGTFSKVDIFNDQLINFWEVDWLKPTLLILGNEGEGIHLELAKTCTKFVTIPHEPIVNSLNVAASAVPLLLERQRSKIETLLKNDREHKTI